MSNERDIEHGKRQGRRPTEGEPQGKGPSGTSPRAEPKGKSGPGLPLQLKITPLDGRDTLKYEDVADK